MRVVVLTGVFLIALVEDELIDVFIMTIHLCLGIVDKEGSGSHFLHVHFCLHF